MASRIVITHPEMGVYLSNCVGLGFWTRLDSVGQPAAVTFPDQAAADAHIRSWESNNNPAAYALVEVRGFGDYANIDDLEAAGLTSLLGNMREEADKYGGAGR